MSVQAVCYDEKLVADGQDIMQIELAVVDGQGRIVDRAQNQLDIVVSGAGNLLGLENGDLADPTPYAESYRRAYRGRLLVYVLSNGEPGTVTVKARAEMLKEAVITLDAEK